VGAARRLASRLVALCGPVVSEAARLSATLSHAFPLPEQVAAADLAALGMPRARRASLKALAEATLANPDLFRAGGSLEEAIARLRAIRGVGDWTAHYIGLLRGAAVGGVRPTSAELLRRAEPWRPWRAYAAQHLWASDALTVAPVERKAAP
jgi:AraC family transcriptional regulator, regulatory protein of adaptative response / DNA-3-methyladenine glycosylase II